MVRYVHKFPELSFLQRAKNKKIGLFGGSFNPLHEGHWQCAEGLRKAGRLDQIWWLPTLQNPLKSLDIQQNFQVRAQEVHARIAHHPKHRLSLLLADPKFYYTIDFLKFLNTFRSSNQLFWLAGSDILGELHRWQNWQELPNYCQMLFYSRPSDGLSKLPVTTRQHLRSFPLVMGKRLKLSSSEIRAIGSL